ncbi:MAG: hypothetical protein I3273_04555 [Candidatus Moeniiplasma glomeromycotorum]|nr:hypothetical protein [Candidatus Moeniiplasma glomeromycotorum]MCE8169366.1 hypothetical protein [Candidatus Moeniiplasma glomeromycotorum]
MTNKIQIQWYKNNKCGVINCDKQVEWGDFFFHFACENHQQQKWGLCEACRNEKTTHTIYYNANGERKRKMDYQGVKEGVEFQKEIIQKFFLTKNISDSLRQKLNAAYQKCQEAEKIIPELEKLTQEHWEKKINLPSDSVQEKGGQQTNIYKCNLCENCGNELDNQQGKLKNDYQINVLNKLVVFDSETAAQIKKEIGKDEAQKIIIEVAFDNKKLKEERVITRWEFARKLPFWGKKSPETLQHKKTFFQKLKQYFQDNQIRQIVEEGGDNYIIWYANGNIEEKSSSQLSEWGKLRTYFFNSSERSLSLHEINRVLGELDQEPNINGKVPNSNGEKEETPFISKDKARNINQKAKENFISDLELELVELFFRQHKVKKIELVNGELIITHDDNSNESINARQMDNNSEYQVIKNSLEKMGKNELNYQELGLDTKVPVETSKSVNSSNGNKYLWLVGGIGLGVVVAVIIFLLLHRKKNKK